MVLEFIKRSVHFFVTQIYTRFTFFRPKNLKIDGKLRVSYDSTFFFDAQTSITINGQLFIKSSNITFTQSEVNIQGGNFENVVLNVHNSKVNLNDKCELYKSSIKINDSFLDTGLLFRVKKYNMTLNEKSTLNIGDYVMFDKSTEKDAFLILNQSSLLAQKNNKIEAAIFCQNALFTIGSNVFINSGTVVRCNEAITIGDNVFISYDCVLIDNNSHSVEPEDRLQEILNGFPNGTVQTIELRPKSKPILIGNNVWVGMRSAVLKGAQIENSAILALNSVVNSKVPNGHLAYGNPFKLKKLELKSEKS